MTFSLSAMLREHAEARPDHIAFVDAGRSVSYAEFDQRSSRIANALHHRGLAGGDRVAILMKNAIDYFEVAFGINKVNGMIVALNWRLSVPELTDILADARPALLVADAEHESLARAAAGETPVIVAGEQFEKWIADSSVEDPDLAGGPDDVALVLYSSGTTGRPKGIMLTNYNLSFLPRMATDLFRMTPDSVHLVASPLFHIGGFGTGLTTTALGGRTVLVKDADPETLLDRIERERVTHAFFVPAVIQRLVELSEARGPDLGSLEVIAYGAAPMSESLLRRSMKTLGCGFVGCYGMTETAGTVVALPPEEHEPEGPRSRLLRSVGRALPWAEVKIGNISTAQDLPPGEVGEILVRCGGNMKGYFNQPEASGQTLLPDGWLRTGDGAFMDEDGYVYLQDRIKDMIISGGENVYPAEVENVLSDHPAVKEVAVIGVPSQRWGETVKAVVVLRTGTNASEQELVEFSRTRLARYKCPTSVDFVAELPRNATGKVLKAALREQYRP